MLADWNHAQALELLAMEPEAVAAPADAPACIPPQALREHVVRLAPEEMQGRSFTLLRSSFGSTRHAVLEPST